MAVFHLNKSERLHRSFYAEKDVLKIARDLIGKLLITRKEGLLTAGRIIETEAYAGVTDKASHAWGGRFTPRTSVMYGQEGTAYVYLCYGIHHLFNVVTHSEGTPHAVLIRALEPVAGTEIMQLRTGAGGLRKLASGPGKLSKAMGISTKDSGTDLTGDTIWIAHDNFFYPSDAILATPRIGVDYAGADAALPYRFIVKGHPEVSGKRQ